MNINPKKIIEKGIVMQAKNTRIQQVGIDLTTAKEIGLKHTEFTSFSVNEEVNIPVDMFALVWSRSTYNRKGIIVRGVVLDPGYHSRPVFSIYNLTGRKIYIPKNERMLQLVFFRAESPSTYKDHYQREGL